MAPKASLGLPKAFCPLGARAEVWRTLCLLVGELSPEKPQPSGEFSLLLLGLASALGSFCSPGRPAPWSPRPACCSPGRGAPWVRLATGSKNIYHLGKPHGGAVYEAHSAEIARQSVGFLLTRSVRSIIVLDCMNYDYIWDLSFRCVRDQEWSRRNGN